MSRDVEGLLARVEAATGPDREIDDALMLVGEYVRAKRHIGATENMFIELGDEDFYPVKDDVWVDIRTDKWVSTQALDFTSSVDAALALVERCMGHAATVEPTIYIGAAHHSCIIWPFERDEPFVAENLRTPALAILAALLRSLAPSSSESET